MNKLIILTFSIFFLFVKSSYSHDPKNCDVLENYDFSQFDNWKVQVIENAPQYDLDKNFVKTLIQDYQVNKRVIENDKCQPEFTLTFSEYIDKRISKLRIQNGINKYNENNNLLQKIKTEMSKEEDSLIQQNAKRKQAGRSGRTWRGNGGIGRGDGPLSSLLGCQFEGGESLASLVRRTKSPGGSQGSKNGGRQSNASK